MNQTQVQLIAQLIRRHPRMGLFILLVFAAVTSVELYHKFSPPHQIADLIDPAKLATLGARAANPRVQKYVAILEGARRSGHDPATVVAKALAIVGMQGEAAELTAEAMLRNLTIAERLGCLHPAGLEEMRQGRAPAVTKGPYQGDRLSVDHIIPFSIVPEFDKIIANLELMPLRMNLSKHAKMGARQEDLLKKLRAAGF